MRPSGLLHTVPSLPFRLPALGHEILTESSQTIQQRLPPAIRGKEHDDAAHLLDVDIARRASVLLGQPHRLTAAVREDLRGSHLGPLHVVYPTVNVSRLSTADSESWHGIARRPDQPQPTERQFGEEYGVEGQPTRFVWPTVHPNPPTFMPACPGRLQAYTFATSLSLPRCTVSQNLLASC